MTYEQEVKCIDILNRLKAVDETRDKLLKLIADANTLICSIEHRKSKYRFCKKHGCLYENECFYCKVLKK